jgi:hypothetical protein
MLAEAALLLKLVIFIAIGDGYAVIGESTYEYETLEECHRDAALVVAELEQEFPTNKFYSACEINTQQLSHM